MGGAQESCPGLYITSTSLAKPSKIFCWRVTGANHLPTGEKKKIPDIFQKLFNFYNLAVKHGVICSIKLDFPTIFVTDLLSID